jgi:hypothetical protein
MSISVELAASTSFEGAIWLISGKSSENAADACGADSGDVMKSRRRTPSLRLPSSLRSGGVSAGRHYPALPRGVREHARRAFQSE